MITMRACASDQKMLMLRHSSRTLGVTKEVLDKLIDRVEISPDKSAQPYFRVPDNTKPRPRKAGARVTPVRMGSQNVEVAGIEPASFSTSPGLLRAQPAVDFSAPAVTQASRRPGSAAVKCPV